MKNLFSVFVLVTIMSSFITCQPDKKNKHYINTIGINMIKIEAGSFDMGSPDTEGDWDEWPKHRVIISQPFYIAQSEVTIEQFRQYQPDATAGEMYESYISGVSWYDAKAFCDWLSKKEGKPYRLPTEAEWEYVCRAGTNSPYSSGESIPDHETENGWGVRNMHTGVLEWCSDWYGPYEQESQKDPIGRESGVVRVIRGGLPDTMTRQYDPPKEFYARSANRAGISPGFGHFAFDDTNISRDLQKGNGEIQKDVLQQNKNYRIGFRIVQAPLPKSEPLPEQIPFIRQGVKQEMGYVNQGPHPEAPYFRLRLMLPIPPDNSERQVIDAAGLHPSFRGHNHSPGLEVCANGDVLLTIFSSYHEYEPGVSLIGARLRFGADQWDMPSPFFDFPDVNDCAPLLWREKERLYLFWGNPRLDSAYPFQWTTSVDNGATFEEVQFPHFIGPVGKHSRQPINSAFRDFNNTLYIPSDGEGGHSVLWASKDNGKSWYDTGGRSDGRHTTYVLLKNGSILGMGGKNTEIDGFMPKSISSDGGLTWEISKTPFPALGSNQRPTIIRLASGRLFFAGDFQRIDGAQPAGIKQHGAYVALSEDEGETWLIKKLPGTRMHESKKRREAMQGETIGYSVARQAPNGIIHLITTMNHPCLHFALNEAWILNNTTKEVPEDELMKSSAKTIQEVQKYQEFFPDGKIRIEYHAGMDDDGRFLLHGKEIWYYKNGNKQYEVDYQLGKKMGQEIYRSADGVKKWEWIYEPDGSSVFRQWWANGKDKSESHWQGKICEGLAKCWDIDGKLISDVDFVNGVPVP